MNLINNVKVRLIFFKTERLNFGGKAKIFQGWSNHLDSVRGINRIFIKDINLQWGIEIK